MLQLRGAPEKMAGLATMVRDGELSLELPEEWERNRVRRTAVNAWTKLIAGARMVGQGELAEAAMRAGDRQCATGEVWPERPLRVGVSNLALHMLVRWSTPMDNATLNLRGWVPPVGPVLDEVPWPEVLVTVARSSDGETLDLVLRPGPTPSDAPVALGFVALRPATSYRLLDGTEVLAECTASAEGTAEVTIPVRGVRTLRLVPVDGAAS